MPHINEHPDNNQHHGASATGAGIRLTTTYKALKSLAFYPADHPHRAENLQNAFDSLKQILKTREIILVTSRGGFISEDGGAPVEASPMAQALARELFIRRIKRLTILPDLTLEDLQSFLNLLASPPLDIQNAGGMEALMFGHSIKTIWANELDLNSISNKRQALEEATGSSDPQPLSASQDREVYQPEDGEPTSREAADTGLTALDFIDIDLDEILARMSCEPDDNTYQHLARMLVTTCDSIKNSEEYAQLLPALATLFAHSSDESLSLMKRAYALFAFEQIAGEKMIGYLVERLEDREYQDKETLIAYLCQMGVEAVPTLIQRLCVAEDMTVRKLLSQTLVLIGDIATPLLVRLLTDERWFVVRNAVTILGEIKDPDSVTALEACLSHQNRRVQKEAVRSIGKISGPLAEDILIDLLYERDMELRRLATLSLGTLRCRKAVPPLIGIVTAPDLTLRSLPLKTEAVQALGRIGDREATTPLLKLLQGRHLLFPRRWRALKAVAALALGTIGDTMAVDTLRSMSGHGGHLGRCCAEALENIEKVQELAHG